jgi:hypothetical protein
MSASKEFFHSDDFVVITVDIENCPVVEFPLTELFDIANATVVDNYLDVVQDYVTQVLEDTTWLDTQSALCMLRSRLCMYHRRNEEELLTCLRQPALQRLISQMLRCRNGVHCDPIAVPLFIRFKCPEITLPRSRTRFPTAISCVSRSNASISSAEAHSFDSSRSNHIPNALCSSTAKASTLAKITTDGFAARITEDTEEGILDGGESALKAPSVTIERLTFDTIQHSAVSTSCPGFVECQKSVVVTSETSTVIYMGTLPRHFTALVPHSADVSCLEAIEDSNRLLPSTNMRFHPIDRGRLRTSAG